VKDGVEVMFRKILIAGRNQRKNLGARVGHVGRGIQPIFKEEKQAEDEARGLALREEIYRQQKRDEPL
jgi:hypothetical protein